MLGRRSVYLGFGESEGFGAVGKPSVWRTLPKPQAPTNPQTAQPHAPRTPTPIPKDARLYLDPVRECYEAYVIYNFYAYLTNFLEVGFGFGVKLIVLRVWSARACSFLRTNFLEVWGLQTLNPKT